VSAERASAARPSLSAVPSDSKAESAEAPAASNTIVGTSAAELAMRSATASLSTNATRASESRKMKAN